jgi:hypothetical protein
MWDNLKMDTKKDKERKNFKEELFTKVLLLEGDDLDMEYINGSIT